MRKDKAGRVQILSMQRALGVVCALVWLVTAARAETSAEPTKPTSLTYLISAFASQPYQVSPPQNGYSGIVTEVLDLVVANSQISVSERVLPYRRLQRGLQEQIFQRWVSYAAPVWLAPEVKALTWVSSTPLFSTSYQLAGLAPNINNPLEAQAQRIIIIDGYRYGGSFSAWVQALGHVLVEAPSHAQALAMLRKDRGDLYVAEDVRIHWEAMRAGIGPDDLALYDFSSIIPDSDVFLIADAGLAEAEKKWLEARLKALQNSGELRRIYDRYLNARFY
ncbi:hypothetical protein QWI17_13660 [Gilvimarinus sp. SDUM040013]|uniref:Solute-binding protein family 3/N-terminal domain-containing protein n=1 Tax=Gilvimarinus gilvus TaxID=3058038 RepID=A0ABU4S2V5_9GAMM|nr:hypothetical protein [Gilvimarinus sp. SDUM040013]MDO3386888.1 hypothetical protein [Gilvimarinus sp. SDUM040013]MDX6851345.1 hypothetical protein [Gilvimarinus sp. SDUM040013]